MAGLNPPQREAAEHGEGPALVLAGAGSGKTRVIAYRIAHLAQAGAARPENILAVTFTNKAAKEMRERVQKLLYAGRSAEPLISTFHSFCVRLLRREIHRLGYKRDFSIYDTDDQKRLVKQTLEEMKLDDDELKPREVLSRISFAKNHGVPPDGYATRFPSDTAQDVEYIYERYEERLHGSNSLDFDDLLLKSVAVLKNNPDLCKHYSNWYRYILVDEYQDTNRPQYDLLRLLTTSHDNLFVVGDEDQSIYKFRGADIGNILKFEKDFPGARVIRLEQNYRSCGTILKVAGAVVANNTERKGKTLWTENPEGEKVSCRRSDTARDEAYMVVGHIRRTLEENPDARVAILYRVGALSRTFEDVLTQQGIPYALVGSVAFFGRAEVKDILAYLRVIFNPEDDAALLRIVNTPPRGIGKTTIDALTSEAIGKGVPLLRLLREKAGDPQFPTRSAKAFQRFLELVDKWTAAQEGTPVANLLATVIQDIRYKEMLQKEESSPETENRIANVEELLQAAAESEQRGETVAEFLDRASLSSELDKLDPEARVALMTLHSAKGLEFDTVFLVGMEEGLFPHSRSSASDAELQEERRLCYVGITRARTKLFVCWTPFRKTHGPGAGFPSRHSRFLDEMPGELVEGLDAIAPGDENVYGPPFPQRPMFTGGGYGYGQHGGEWREDRHADWRDRAPAHVHAVSGAPKPVPPREGRDDAATGAATANQPKSIAELKSYLEKMQQAAASYRPPAAKAAADSGLREGMRVRHDRFGDGIVLRRERSGDDYKVTVTFSLVGKKTLVEKYAKLQKL
ncbi:MAG: UvrD-helicase domain-containing protein [Acidobacteriota bacterium]|nr:UvrD-helicase domain-containing protein [Acidobacteriota bacterium]